MQYWLLKSEPHCWSWANQIEANTTSWDGVRNYQAQSYLKEMHIEDLCFFYHSHECKIVGIVSVVKAFYLDSHDMRFGNIDVQTIRTLKRSIGLKEIKSFDHLSHLALVRQSRLSCMPIDKKAWDFILGLEAQ